MTPVKSLKGTPMLKKVTTVISQNKNDILRKALVLGGITAGMAISTLLNKTNEPQIIVQEEVTDVETSFESDTPDTEN